MLTGLKVALNKHLPPSNRHVPTSSSIKGPQHYRLPPLPDPNLIQVDIFNPNNNPIGLIHRIPKLGLPTPRRPDPSPPLTCIEVYPVVSRVTNHPLYTCSMFALLPHRYSMSWASIHLVIDLLTPHQHSVSICMYHAGLYSHLLRPRVPTLDEHLDIRPSPTTRSCSGSTSRPAYPEQRQRPGVLPIQ